MSRSRDGRNESKVPLVVDTREQMPWRFPESKVTSIVDTLHAGDYSLVGYETRVAIERKSLADLTMTLTHGRDRFRRELEKLMGYYYAWIIVEASFQDVLDHAYVSLASPESIIGSCAAIECRYGIAVHFAGGRRQAARLAYELLRRTWLDEQMSHAIGSLSSQDGSGTTQRDEPGKDANLEKCKAP
jgi:DNA excision repair protein ERCC-4